MKKKTATCFFLTASILLTLCGCGSTGSSADTASRTADTENDTPDSSDTDSNGIDTSDETFERTIDITLDGYEPVNGLLSAKDADGTVYEFDTIGLLAAPGETIGDVMDYTDLTPVCDGYTFEGWLEYAYTMTTDADGFEEERREIISDQLYSTDELLALTVPDHEIMYVAKWDAIPIEEYFVTDPLAAYVDSSSSGGFAFAANGGELVFFNSEQGEEYSGIGFCYWLDDDQALNDIMGTEYNDALIGIEKEGAEFDGWTLYEAESLFFIEEKHENDELKCFSFTEDEDYGVYALLQNPVLYGEHLPTEQLCAITCEGKNFYAVATWK